MSTAASFEDTRSSRCRSWFARHRSRSARCRSRSARCRSRSARCRSRWAWAPLATVSLLEGCFLFLDGAAAAAPRHQREVPAAAHSETAGEIITISVDASEAPRRIFHSHLVIPAKPGPLTLVYPKWTPGEHGPTGPIADLAALDVSMSGRRLAWTRDLEDMYAIHCEVPRGAASVNVDFDYLSPPTAEGFTSAASASDRLALVSWNQVVVYPKGRSPDSLRYTATLRIPQGWKYGTALPVSHESGDRIDFSPVSLTTLIDSPVVTGAFFRTITLDGQRPGTVEMHIAADSEAALQMPLEVKDQYVRLVAEENALFGAHHYRSYHFLLSLSDVVAHFGLEHHESSDNRTYERGLVDEDRRELMASLLSHEMVHSWNGKYRRPAGLATPDYQQPMKGDLLWVYEGLTNYLGHILSARSGLRTPEQYRDVLALDTATLDQESGRKWRPLLDTAAAAQILYEARRDWADWRRGVDFYPEGDLIWLEADVIIRQRTNGRKSLDDFCRRFHGGESGPPSVKTYTFDDVVSAMNETAPYDWRTFFNSRVSSLAPHAPLGGIEGGGWRLVYNEVIPGHLKAYEEARETTDVSYSIGLKIDKEGKIIDVVRGLPAEKAGIAPGMKLMAVNGRKWSKKWLREMIRASRTSSEPLELLVENAEYYKTFKIDYHGGERYPHLERDPGRPDLLSEILKPLRP